MDCLLMLIFCIGTAADSMLGPKFPTKAEVYSHRPAHVSIVRHAFGMSTGINSFSAQPMKSFRFYRFLPIVAPLPANAQPQSHDDSSLRLSRLIVLRAETPLRTSGDSGAQRQNLS